MKRVLGGLFRLAGCDVEMEQGPSDSLERPADVLVRGFRAKPLSVDTTIWSRMLYPADPLDAVVEAKLAHHKPICARMGWTAAVFAADVYGAMHPHAQQLMAKLALRVASRGYLGDFRRDYSAVWGSITAAIVSRAASQLLQHALRDDEPEFVDEVLGTSPALLPDPDDAPVPDTASAPARDAEAQMEEDEADDGSAEIDIIEEDEPAPQEAQPPVHGAEEEATITLAVRLPTGSVLPVRVSDLLVAGSLLERLRAECGLPESAQPRLGLALGYAALDLSRSLRENDVEGGDTLTLLLRQ